MNRYFTPIPDRYIIQSPISFEPTEQALNSCSPVIESPQELQLFNSLLKTGNAEQDNT